MAHEVTDPQVHWHTATGLNTLGPKQNGRDYADDTFKCIFLT